MAYRARRIRIDLNLGKPSANLLCGDMQTGSLKMIIPFIHHFEYSLLTLFSFKIAVDCVNHQIMWCLFFMSSKQFNSFTLRFMELDGDID